MFRVPTNAEAPTFDHTFKVGFMQWLTSNGVERIEWMRRRREAAETARVNQNGRTEAYVARKVAGVVDRSERGLAQRVAEGKTTQEQADLTMNKIREAAAQS
jgi:hypothetical protein